MKIYTSFLLIALALVLFISCEKENNIDTEKPSINTDFPGAFPMNCDTVYFGESFELIVKFSDNTELGSYSITIHNNFDHHSHSTEVIECNLDPIKDPVNPFSFIEDYSIPANLKEYETNVSITIPKENGSGRYDEGDYHFFISLTDKEGWSAQKGLSIKMLHR